MATVTGGRPRYDKSGVGGIAGLFNECTITNSYNYGTVSRNKDSVNCAMGGAIGFDRKSSTGKLEEVAAKAENSGSIRFCYGISADQYGSAAGAFFLLCICRRHGMIISVMSKGKHA